MINDIDRKTISRWRLSSHSLYMETGRYKRPKIPTEHRLCTICLVVEDAMHTLFKRKAHEFIGYRYIKVLEKYESVGKLLNPQSQQIKRLLGKYLREIEDDSIVQR